MITEEQAMKLLIEANPVPDMSTLNLNGDLPTTRLAELDTRSSEMTQLKPEPSVTSPTSSRRRLMVGIAAAAAILFVGVILFRTNRAPVADTRAPVETARAFVEAYRGSFDVDEAFTYLAADPEPAGFDPVDEERLLARFLEATGSKLFDLHCEELSASAEGTLVSCTYMSHDFFSDEMGLGPYRPDGFELTIVDGKIVSIAEAVGEVIDFSDPEGFSKQIWEPFAAWIGDNHLDDVTVMYDPYPTGWRISEESIPIWEQHLREYVKEVTGQGTADDTSTGLGVFEPARGRVVFPVGNHLLAVDPDDPSSANIIEPGDLGLGVHAMPAGFSSDGAKLAIEDEYNGESYVMDGAGSLQRVPLEELGLGGGCCTFSTSAWLSPDGTKGLAFAQPGTGSDGLYVLDLDDIGQSRFIELDHFRWADGVFSQPPFPVWSPDGSRAAYVWSKGGDLETPAVGIVDLAGGGSREVVGARWGLIRNLAWSPDGSQLLVVAGLEAPLYSNSLNPMVNRLSAGLYLVDIDDGEAREIDPGFYVAAAWSPDGTRIAAIDYGTAVVMNADGSDRRVLGTSGWEFTGVAWHPVPAP